MQSEELNAVYVFNTNILDCDPLKSRDAMREFTDACALKTDDDRRFLDRELSELLNTPDYVKVCSFFDRDERVFNWHYTMYAREHCDEPANTIAAIVSGGKEVRGPVVIVKDCPAEHWERLSTDVSADSVTRTLWWYWKSGRDARAEFGERTLIRLLASGEL